MIVFNFEFELAADAAVGTDSGYHTVGRFGLIDAPLYKSTGRAGVHTGTAELASSILKSLLVQGGDNVTPEATLCLGYCSIPIPCLLDLVEAPDADFVREMRNRGRLFFRGVFPEPCCGFFSRDERF